MSIACSQALPFERSCLKDGRFLELIPKPDLIITGNQKRINYSSINQKTDTQKINANIEKKAHSCNREIGKGINQKLPGQKVAVEEKHFPLIS